VNKRHIAVKDLMKLRFITDPQISPDGSRIAYGVTRIDPESRTYRYVIRLIEADMRDRCIVRDGNRPVWSPDSRRLAFLSQRSGTRQVWLTEEGLGEPIQISFMRHGVSDMAWSPDGTRMLIVSGCWDEEDKELLVREMTPAEKEELRKAAADEPFIVDQIAYKADEVGGMLPRLRKQLWLLDMDTGELESITPDDVHIFSRHGGTPIWSPDSRYIAYLSGHDAQKEMSPYMAANASDLYVFDTMDHSTRRLVQGNGAVAYPVWSPDSQSLGYFWYDDLKHLTSSTIPTLWRIPVEDGNGVCLTQDQVLSVHVPIQSDLMIGALPTTPIWTQNGRILFWAAWNGRAQIYSVSDKGGSIESVTNVAGSVFGFSADTSGEKLALGVMTETWPMEIFEYQVDSGEIKQMTWINEKLMGELILTKPKGFSYRSADGTPLQGWMMEPLAGSENSYPLILHVHGGPHLLYGEAFNFEFQLMAAQGYGVVYINPRGSAGYGQEFLRGCCGDFGGKDYEDLMTGLDYALSKFPKADAQKLGVTGLSYGGFMTNWIIGHTKRFHAAVTKNCLSNFTSFAGVSDIGYFFLEGELLGSPWRDMDAMRSFSPITYVENIETPLLIMHTEDDQRCPKEQSEQLYVAMKYFEKDVAFLRFPSGNHLMYRLGYPPLRVAWLRECIKWFDRYLK
jgi:dipeptidyl aminopeptidase/acylaminoacyl peptidase